MRRLGGLYRAMPITATLATVAAAAMAGVPLLNGFLSKEMFFAETLEMEGPSRFLDRLLPYVATAWGIFSVAYSARIVHDVFIARPRAPLPRTPHEPPRWMRFPIELLVVACLAVGVLPALTIGPFLDTAVRSILGAQTPAYSLAVWHGLNAPFLMSVAAMAGGVALYALLRGRLARGTEGAPLLPRVDGREVFERVLFAVGRRWPRAVERTAGTQRLQAQLLCLVLAALAAALWPMWRHDLATGPLPSTPIDPTIAAACAIGSACAIGAAWQARFHRFAALLFNGGAGLVVCLVFVRMAAPDLALTQLLVEIVTTVLLLLGLRWLPRRSPRPAAPGALARRGRDLAIALACGGGLAALAYAIMTRPLPDHTVSRFFVDRAWPEGGGTNVVNVIIVDFRGFDTLAEIAVLAVVGLVVYALLRRFRPAAESLATPARRQSRDAAAEEMAIPAVIMRAMFPVIALLAAYLLWRGHNAPGGGFAAGVALAIAVILQYMAGGTRWAEDRLAIRPMRWMGAGLLAAAATGAGAWLFGHPFLTSHTAHVSLPVLGELHVPSAFFFDLGVFFLVVGATGLLLIVLAHQSVRHPWN
jgi:multicomponent K+:H+ antiporter subunit A